MTNSSKSNLRNILTIIFSFFLSLFLFLLCGLFIINNTVFNPDYMRNQLNKSNYYENVTQEVESEFTSYGAASGFNEEFFKTVLDLNDVQLNVNQSLNLLYGSSENTIDTTNFEKNLNLKLIENVNSRGIKITPETEKALHLLTKTCADTYAQYISIPYIKQLSPIIQMLKKPILYSEVFLFVLIILLAVLIFGLNHWRHRAIRAYIYSVSGTMLMLLVFPIIFLFSGKVNNVALISKSLYEFFVCYLNDFALMFFQLTLILTVPLSVLIILYRFMLRQVQ